MHWICRKTSLSSSVILVIPIQTMIIRNMRTRFDEKMALYCQNCSDVIRKPWTSETVRNAIAEVKAARTAKVKNMKQYAVCRKYDTMEVGGNTVLVKKNKKNRNLKTHSL